MARKFYNSNSDGTINEEIQSGEIGNVFSLLTTAMRYAGDDKRKKIWIESDTDETVFITIHHTSNYYDCVFVSANDDDSEDDLTGDEDRFGTMTIASISENDDEIITKNDNAWEMARVGDNILIGGDIYEIDSVTDNGDETITISTTQNIAVVPQLRDTVRSAIKLDLSANEPKPFWIEQKVPAGAPRFSSYERTLIGVYF
jgi:hypothetical protein